MKPELRVPEVVLAAWCAWFAALHAAWALGWRWGVPVDQPPIARRPVFLAYDVAAGLLVLAAGVVAAGLAAGRWSVPSRRRLRPLVLVGSVLAGLRGLVGLAGDVAAWSQARPVTAVTLVADVWFLVAALLGLLVRRRITPPGLAGGPGAGA